MALTINQFSRYRVIHECLKNRFHRPSSSDNPEDRGCWTLDELIDKITEKMDLEKPPSKRQVQEDIKRMRDDPDLAYWAPIKNKRGVGYYYTEPDYELNDRPLSPVELNALREIVGFIRQFKGFKYFENAEGIIHELEQSINRSEFQDVQFDVLPGYCGLEFIEPIKKAIRNKKVVGMYYKAFYEKEESFRHIHPYLLKEHNNRWFVYAYTDEYTSERVYALDRIKKLVPVEKKYRKPDKKKIVSYFKDIIGVTNIKERKTEDIVLRIKSERANYLITKPIHHSQRIIKRDNGYVWFGFRLKPNNELNSFILSYDKDVVVEKPDSLAEEIKEILKEALSNYK